MYREGAMLLPAIANAELRAAWSSARPLIGSRGANTGRELSRTFKTFDHADSDGVAGFVTVPGGKRTTLRATRAAGMRDGHGRARRPDDGRAARQPPGPDRPGRGHAGLPRALLRGASGAAHERGTAAVVARRGSRPARALRGLHRVRPLSVRVPDRRDCPA